MKITILGSNGFLSNAIAKCANKNNWTLDVYGLDEPVGVQYDKFVKCNLMDAELDCSGLLGADIIVYAIGAGIQSNLKEGYNLIYSLNVTAPVTICNKLKELDYKGVFVTFGSVFEMGETSEAHSFTEEEVMSSSAPAPSDYVVSKRMLTRFVTSYKHDFTHWHFIIPTIYGEGENPKRLIPYTINAIKNGEELHFTAGDQTRQYVYVAEVPRLIELSFQKRLPSGIYNIQGKETLTVKEIVTLIHKEMGKNVPEDCFGTAQRTDVGMKYLALNGKKLFDSIGYVSTVGIQDVLNLY
jgi:nucleoside-diphosphate-sugar epimerase